MRVIAFDFETFLIEPGVQAPQPVCMAYAESGAGGPSLVTARDCWPLLRSWLADPDVWLVGANVQFDLNVAAAWCPDDDFLNLVLSAYDDGRIFDIQVRDKLLMLAEGRLAFDARSGTIPSFSLAALAERWVGVTVHKGADTWRTRYAELVDREIQDYPEDAAEYALKDALYTLQVFEAQNAGQVVPFVNETEQHHADFCLGLMSVVGLRVDAAAVARLQAELLRDIEALGVDLAATGIKRPNGTKNMARLREVVAAGYARQGLNPPLTEKGAVSTASETLLESGDPLLVRMGELSGSEKLLSSFIPNLANGVINPRYDVLKETGRTSSFKPNIQQMPRKGGIRELFLPPDGFVFLDADYSTLELCALSQACLDLFGFSDMANYINAGQDLHLVTASDLLGITYDEAVKRYETDDSEVAEMRQISKAANFGFPGGMGANSFVEFARGYGLALEVGFVQRLRDNWLATYSEMRAYFDYISRLSGGRESFDLEQLRTGRIRGGCRYTSGCNTLFQGLAADGAKAAMILLTRACYTDKTSPLYGCFIHAFVHDEFLVSCPEDRVDPAARELERLMVSGMSRLIPDVEIRASVTAARNWTKKAKRVVDADGRLCVWSPC